MRCDLNQERIIRGKFKNSISPFKFIEILSSDWSVVKDQNQRYDICFK